MSTDDDTTQPTASLDPLTAVADAAGARLRARAENDEGAARTASESLMRATMSAMSAGHSLRDITAAEGRGENAVRSDVRGDILKRIDRAARHLREAEATYHAAIERGLRVGLSTRQIAEHARVTHGTIRALAQRLKPSAPPEGAAVVPSHATTAGVAAPPGTAET